MLQTRIWESSMCSVSHFFTANTSSSISPLRRSFVASSLGRVIAQERNERKKERTLLLFFSPVFRLSQQLQEEWRGRGKEEAGESFSAKFDWRLKAGVREGEERGRRRKRKRRASWENFVRGKDEMGDRKV